MSENNNLSENTKGVYVHKFKTPFEYEDKTYETITFNFGKLTGRDMINIETQMQQNGEYALSAEYSRSFQCYLASKAADIGNDVIEAFPFSDFNKITNAVRNFLLSAGF